MRRILVLPIALMLVVLVTGACTSSSPSPTASPPAWKTYTDTKYGWTISYPPDWHVQPYAEMLGQTFIRGLLVSNTQHHFVHPDLGANSYTSAWSMEGLPSDAVVLEIQDPTDGGPPPLDNGRLPDTPLPLSMENAKWTSANSWKGQPFREGGTSYILRTNIGTGVSKDQKAAAQQVVSSLSFPTSSASVSPPRPGSWDTVVLGHSIRFSPAPVGSDEHALTSEEALAAYRAVNKEFHPASQMTPRLGLFTDKGYTKADGTHPYTNRLAWGFSWETTGCPVLPIGPGQTPSPCPSPPTITHWLFLDAKTGKMLLGT
jgi:hypothetical protein